MSFVVIVEPNYQDAEKIKAILEAAADKEFTYELVKTPDKAIDLVESRQVDVLISALKMPVMTGSELFDMVRMISPETVPVVLADTEKMPETVAFMNECKAFKVIIKPCRVADDLLSPINASIEYKALCARSREEGENADKGISSTERDRQQLLERSTDQTQRYEQALKSLTEQLQKNIGMGGLETETERQLGEWYEWMADCYVKTTIEAKPDFEMCQKSLMKEFHQPDAGCSFAFGCRNGIQIPAKQMGELSFAVHSLAELCRRFLFQYEIKAAIEEAQKAYILRFSCLPIAVPDESGRTPQKLSLREENRAVVKALLRATELFFAAFSMQAVKLEKDGRIFVNVASVRTLEKAEH